MQKIPNHLQPSRLSMTVEHELEHCYTVIIDFKLLIYFRKRFPEIVKILQSYNFFI